MSGSSESGDPMLWELRREMVKLVTLTCRHTMVAVCHTFLSSCNNENPLGLCTHPVLISFLLHNTTYHLALVLFTGQPYESGVYHPLAFENLSQFLLSDIISGLTLPDGLFDP